MPTGMADHNIIRLTIIENIIQHSVQRLPALNRFIGMPIMDHQFPRLLVRLCMILLKSHGINNDGAAIFEKN
jgi:hypothetical protein